MTLASALKQLLWIKQIFEKCGVKINKPILVHEDNEACIAVATNPMSQKRTRHIDIKHHFIRDYVSDETIKIVWCPTSEMLADIMTEALTGSALKTERPKILSNRTL